MADMLWLDEIEHINNKHRPPYSDCRECRQIGVLIAAVRLAEIGWAVALSDLQRAVELFADEGRIQRDYLRAIIANKTLYARLRSGEVGGK